MAECVDLDVRVYWLFNSYFCFGLLSYWACWACGIKLSRIVQYLLGLFCFNRHSSSPPIQATAAAIFAISSLSLVLNVPCLSGFLFFFFTMPPNLSISCDLGRIQFCFPQADLSLLPSLCISQAELGSRWSPYLEGRPPRELQWCWWEVGLVSQQVVLR